MSETIKRSVALPEEALKAIEKRLEVLSEKGVAISNEHTSELNFAGCKSSSCMAYA